MSFNGNWHGKIRSLLNNDEVYDNISKYIDNNNWKQTQDAFSGRGCFSTTDFIEFDIDAGMLDNIFGDQFCVHWEHPNKYGGMIGANKIEERPHDHVIKFNYTFFLGQTILYI